ncbi:hypothetical protein ET445_09445 [Agromyces protaetiae]|uniref:Uncharacterized protein n=1 Tax=Agromyces protaetiae TaxID=2509455 RepID=A0A4P6FSK5_9MICO|nr:hypothetical protein [Agromyces protaetiae]QAY73528.1 hypothetical protein ET445_09445 [Agromyces protaetiae]
MNAQTPNSDGPNPGGHDEPGIPDLDPVARLRDADPAAGIEARAGFADEVVARAAADVAADTAPETSGTPETSGHDAPVADLATERARRRPRRWAGIAAVAASLVIVGGAGYGIGAAANAGGGSTLADGAAPPISLQGVTQGGASERAGGGAPGAEKMAAGATDLRYPGGFFGGRNTFRASGLSTEAGNAQGYTFDARGASNPETIGQVAHTLGLEGTPELKDGGWVLGPQDGSSPSLWASLDGTLSFSYNNPQLNPWKCAADGSSCEPSGALPSEQAAIDALRSLIAATGRDAATYEFASQTYEGAVTRAAQAYPVVDGQRLDVSWYLELAEGGVVSASGQLAAIVPLGEYPVVSAQEAFERLSDPRFGAQAGIMPMAARADTTGGAIAESLEVAPDAPVEWTPPTEPPATPTAGIALSWPVNDVEIVSARLGLASQWQPDGSVLIVPAYEFTDASGGTWSVIAVADSKLDFATK